MNNKKNTDIISIVQNHYRRESTISVAAPIEDVHKTFVALSKTGMHITFWKFDVRCYGRIVELDGPPSSRSLRLVTRATLEQQLNRDGTTINLSTQIPKEEIINWIFQIFIFFIILLSFLIYLELEPWIMSISYIGYSLLAYLYTWSSFDGTTDLLIRYLQRDQVWNGLGYEKQKINNPWIWREKK